MTTTITGAAITTATVAATTSVTTDLIQYDTAKDEAGGFTKQQVVQIVNVTTGAVATGTTQLPYDDTIQSYQTMTLFRKLPKEMNTILWQLHQNQLVIY